MKKISEVMHTGVECLEPTANLQVVAQIMRELDVGSIPVCDQGRLTGMVTDRDIVVRAIAEGKGIEQTTARDIMSSPIVYCFADQDIEDVLRIMEARQIRRIVVLDREKKLVGVVALKDLVERGAGEELTGELIGKVVEGERRTA